MQAHNDYYTEMETKSVSPQKMDWTTIASFDNYEEADALRKSLVEKGAKAKIRLGVKKEATTFRVMTGEPVGKKAKKVGEPGEEEAPIVKKNPGRNDKTFKRKYAES